MGLFGKALKTDVLTCNEHIEMLIDGMLAEESTTMFFAGDGVGKSTLTLQMALQASSGIPLFGALEVKRPLKVMYVMAERPKREAYQRIVTMMKKININWDNFYFEWELQGFDLLIPEHRHTLEKKIAEKAKEFGGVDWLHIDPIYAWISKELVGESGAGAINGLLRNLQTNLKCCLSYNHHTNRGVRNKEGKRDSEDMYGNRFLRANCTAVFHIVGKDDKTGTLFKKDKDSYSCLHNEISLSFDPQFYLSELDSKSKFISKKDLVMSFIRECKKENKTFDFEDFCIQNELSTAYGRIMLSRQIEDGRIKCLNPNNRKHLYMVVNAL